MLSPSARVTVVRVMMMSVVALGTWSCANDASMLTAPADAMISAYTMPSSLGPSTPLPFGMVISQSNLNNCDVREGRRTALGTFKGYNERKEGRQWFMPQRTRPLRNIR